jgi:hypothetical protein
LKVAVQAMFPVIVTLPPGQLVDQPANVEPEAALATRLTFVPLLRLVVHVVLAQLIPVGPLTVPVPVPARVTVSVYVVVIGLNTAVQVMLAFIVMVLPQPVPDQLAKV